MKLESLALVLDAMNDRAWYVNNSKRWLVHDTNGAVVVSANTEGDAEGVALLHNTRYQVLRILQAVSELRGASEEWYAQVALSSREGKVSRHLLTSAIDKCVSSLQELESL